MPTQRLDLYLLAPLGSDAHLRALGEELRRALGLAPRGADQGGGLCRLSLGARLASGRAEEAERLRLLTALLPTLRHSPYALYFPRLGAERVARWAFDLDGTLVPDELLPQLARGYGRGEAMSQLTEVAMQGKVPFATSFAERTKLLSGLPLSAFTELADSLHLPEGTERLLTLLYKEGFPLALVSGNYRPLVERLAQRLALPHTLGSEILASADGRLLGLAPAGIVDEAGKRSFLQTWGEPLATCYLGDGANDLPALASVGHAFLVGEGFVRSGQLAHLPHFLHHLPTA